MDAAVLQDFFQLLQPGLQLLRPPKKDYAGPLLGGMVPYNSQSFQEEWDLQPSQVSATRLCHATPVDDGLCLWWLYLWLRSMALL